VKKGERVHLDYVHTIAAGIAMHWHTRMFQK